MHNINIMCMMENNYRKFFSTSQKKDLNNSMVSRCFEKNEIILGKRGRPSKSSAPSPCILPEKMMGPYVTSIRSTRDSEQNSKKFDSIYGSEKKTKFMNHPGKATEFHLYPPESLVSTSMLSSSSRINMPGYMKPPYQIKQPPKLEPKPKENRKKCPVYFDEMFMELLYITQKQANQTPIFFIKRNVSFDQINNRLVCIEERENDPANRKERENDQDLGHRERQFDLLKHEQHLICKHQRSKSKGDKVYNFGEYLENYPHLGKEKTYLDFASVKRSKSSSNPDRGPRGYEMRSRRKKRRRGNRRDEVEYSKPKGSHSFCEYCNKRFGSFLEFLHHVQTVHQANVEEVV